jgi:hypothetical protein
MERRSSLRYACRLAVAVTLETDSTRVDGVIVNLSCGGAAVLLPCEFALGTELSIHIQGRKKSQGGYIRSASVIHGASATQDGWLHGGVFLMPLSVDQVRYLLEP